MAGTYRENSFGRHSRTSRVQGDRPGGGSQKQRLKNEQTVITIGRIDYVALIAIILLVLIGVIMVFSAGYYKTASSSYYNYDEYYFLKRQLLFAVLGFGILAFFSGINYRFWMRFSLPMYIVANALVGLVPVIGEEVNGARRWIKVPVINQFQPSEVAKVAIIFVLAYLIYKNKGILTTLGGFATCSALVLASAALVLLGSLSSAIIIGLIGFGIIFIASPYIWRFVIVAGGGIGVVATYILFFSESFRLGRIDAWLDPFAYSNNEGYQIVQSLYAIGSGGPFGLGIGQSRQKSFLPEMHNDFIFSIICEELGLIGAGLVIVLFSILIWRGMRIAMKAPDVFSSLLASGIVLVIGSQTVINIAVVTNSMPNTGITLPLVSYGGTSLMITMFMMGVLLSISRYSKE